MKKRQKLKGNSYLFTTKHVDDELEVDSNKPISELTDPEDVDDSIDEDEELGSDLYEYRTLASRNKEGW